MKERDKDRHDGWGHHHDRNDDNYGKKVTIRLFQGLWRRIERGTIRSFDTYALALLNGKCWEESDSYTSEYDLDGIWKLVRC